MHGSHAAWTNLGMPTCQGPNPSDILPSSCYTCSARATGFCSAINLGMHARLAGRQSWLDLPANHLLPCDNPSGTYAGILVRGYLRVVHYAEDGGRQIVDLRCPGEFIGFRGLNTDLLVLETATKVRICRFDDGEYNRLIATRPEFRRFVYAQVKSEIDRLRYFTWSLGALDPRARMAAFFVKATSFMPWQRLPTGGGILILELPRADIADLLGTTIESISRIIQKMARNGYIRIHDPKHLEIPDLEILAQVGALARTGMPGTSGLFSQPSCDIDDERQ